MAGVLVGFGIIGTVILLGFFVGRTRVLGAGADYALSRLVFFALTPCLLFTVLADADVHLLFSSVLTVSLLSAVVAFAVFALVARFLWKRSVAETTIGALASGYVNANNIGIPVAVYVLNDAQASAPVILLQLLVFAPIALGILDASSSGRTSYRRILLTTVRNPIIIGSVLGLVVAITGLDLPDLLMEPFRLIGAAAVPVVLIAFGMSLSGTRLLEAGPHRRDVLLATGIKLVLMPLVAWLVSRFVFGLDGQLLFSIVVLATLPSAQNVFTFSQRYECGEIVARDAVLLTTVLAIPALAIVAVLLAPGT